MPFQQHLIDHHVFPSEYANYPDGRIHPRPKNEKVILKRLRQRRPSLSPSCFSKKAFRQFMLDHTAAVTESMVMAKPLTTMLGDSDVLSLRDVLFANLAPLTNGTIVDAKPDFYDGVQPALIKTQIREELGPYIIPSPRTHLAVLPTFFFEAKKPSGDAVVAARQAWYDGTIGARAVHQLQAFGTGSKPTYDGNTYSLATTYVDGLLKIFTVHPLPSSEPDVGPEYHFTQIGGWYIAGSATQFRQGVGAFRNARDWANEERVRLVADANRRVTSGVEKTAPKSTSGRDTM
jgi:hypothetical protein